MAVRVAFGGSGVGEGAGVGSSAKATGAIRNTITIAIKKLIHLFVMCISPLLAAQSKGQTA